MLSPEERITLLVRLGVLAEALAPIGEQMYRNELCDCDPEWSSHGPRCVWNAVQELLPGVEKHRDALREEIGS